MDENEFYIMEMRDKLAEFMDYGILKQSLGKRTIYYDKPTTEKEEKEFRKQIFLYAANKMITEWNPLESVYDAYQCKERLRELGEYNIIEFDYKYSQDGFGIAKKINMDVVRITFAGSIPNKNIRGEGKNELEAICDACIKFIEIENNPEE